MIKTNKNTIHTNNNTKSNVTAKRANSNHEDTSIKRCVNKYKKSRKARRSRDWAAQTQALKNRTKVSLLVSPEVFLPPKQKKHVGRKQEYSDALILFLASLREIFKQPFRQTIGLAEDLAILQGVKLPSYNRLCVRMQQLKVEQKLDHRHFKKVCLLVDSTGLKTKGEGEWKEEKHGLSCRRGWLKLHLSVDYRTQTILSHVETPETVVDQAVTTQLIDEADVSNDNIDEVIGDGAYGSHKLYQEIEGERGITLISPPRKNAKLHVKFKETHPGRGGSGGKYADFTDEPGWETQNGYLRECMENGWDEWKDNIEYHERSLVETTMWRLKSAFSDKVKSTSPKNQSVEVAIRIMLMNKWTMQNQDIYKKKTKKVKSR